MKTNKIITKKKLVISWVITGFMIVLFPLINVISNVANPYVNITETHTTTLISGGYKRFHITLHTSKPTYGGYVFLQYYDPYWESYGTFNTYMPSHATSHYFTVSLSDYISSINIEPGCTLVHLWDYNTLYGIFASIVPLIYSINISIKYKKQ